MTDLFTTEYNVDGMRFTDKDEAIKYVTTLKPLMALKKIIMVEIGDAINDDAQIDLITRWIADEIVNTDGLLESLIVYKERS